MALPFSAGELEALLCALPDPAFVLTASGRYAAIMGGTDTRYYHDGSVLLGQRLHDVLQPTKADWFLGRIRHVLHAGGMHVVEYELSNRDVLGLCDDGPSEPIWFEGRITPLPFAVQGEPSVLWVASNISRRHALERQLRALSETDELTGLANRRHLIAELTTEYEAWVRYGQPAAVLYLDVDRFKQINDTLGHAAGDAALRAVAATLRERLRRTDLAARLGGDEFVVLCRHCGADQAETLAQQLTQPLDAALQAFAWPGGAPSVSVGWAALCPTDATTADVLRRADEHLYRVKRAQQTSGGRPAVARVETDPV